MDLSILPIDTQMDTGLPSFGQPMPLTSEDMARLKEPREHVRGGSNLKRLSERHHAIARMLVMGVAPTEVAVIFNLTTVYINMLKGDPSFCELLNIYRQGEVEVLRSTQERLSAVTNDALDLISERFEDEEERKKITLGTAIEVVKMGADRSGNGPQSTTVAVNIHAGLADKMKQARQLALAAMIDITPVQAAE